MTSQGKISQNYSDSLPTFRAWWRGRGVDDAETNELFKTSVILGETSLMAWLGCAPWYRVGISDSRKHNKLFYTFSNCRETSFEVVENIKTMISRIK